MTEAELASMETEALAETGNVILKGCLDSIANMLQNPVKMSVPAVLHGTSEALFEAGQEQETFILFLYIDFSLRDREIRGYIAMIVD
jgi:chemotaxis protein CheC